MSQGICANSSNVVIRFRFVNVFLFGKLQVTQSEAFVIMLVYDVDIDDNVNHSFVK